MVARILSRGTLSRLNAVGCKNTKLSGLWQTIEEENADPDAAKYRRIEAEMGFDPDECPKPLMDKALELDHDIGTATLSELAPIYGKSSAQGRIGSIRKIARSRGHVGKPSVPCRPSKARIRRGAPWQRAVEAARELRQIIGSRQGTMSNDMLCDLLGLRTSDVEGFAPVKSAHAAVAIPEDGGKFRFIPRKSSPKGRRFELARLLGDYFIADATDGQWLASTDLSTSRQKYQRAFAAEFLCPIEQLKEFLQGYYSEFAIEEAAEHFQVSPLAVGSLLTNNGLIQRSFYSDYVDAGLSYQFCR